MPLDGFSCDVDNPKYRTYAYGKVLIEYTLARDEVTIDWIVGSGAASAMKLILLHEGEGVTKISGYVTDKLGGTDPLVLQRFGKRVAAQLGTEWMIYVKLIEGRRYLVFQK